VSVLPVAAPTRGRTHRVHALARTSPFSLLWLGAALAAASLIAITLTPAAFGLAIDEAQQLGATGAAVVAMLLAARRADPAGRFASRGLAVATILIGLGMLVWDLQPGSWSEGAGPGDTLFAASLVTLVITFARAVFGGMDRSRIAEIALDTTIVLIATATVLAMIWQRLLDPAGRDDQEATAIACALGGIAGPVAVVLALLHRGVRPSFRGVYAALSGVTLLALSMVLWQVLSAQGSGSAVGPTDYMYSAGVLIAAFGCATWDVSGSAGLRFVKFAQAAVDILPLFAVALCVALLLLLPRATGLGVEEIGTGAVVVLALARQVLLTVTERRARAAERDASARLEREIRARATVLHSLARLEAADTPEETAARMCREALRLDGIDQAIVLAFGSNGEAIVVGLEGSGGSAASVGTRLRVERSEQLARNAAAGPWTDTLAPAPDPDDATPGPTACVMANAPLLWNDRVIGVIGLGGSPSESRRVVAERLTTVREFGVVAGALMGPPLAERARLEKVHETVSRIIDGRAFHPVFQPIVDLASQRIVGYEALTRFDSGERPDLCFANAAAVGLGRLLETACLRSAQYDAIALPADTWLSLNVSPELAVAQLPLLAVLESSERDIVLEITEHAPVASYADLAAALDLLRGQVRIAVDDAGAGYAGLEHILEIRPDIVKLDISLVRGVDADPVRRALVAGMVAFAREGGCSLLAEGIETEAELTTLRTLGVPLGQGYLLGRPVSIDVIAAAAAA
jgi:EAL domain-containing protein (putative c-di-GMP-specific phosphodiesterase class I)